MKKPEILAPAGNREKLEVAVTYGADAVYLGGNYGLRTAAASFEGESLEEAVQFAHARGVKVYVTVNVFARNDDFNCLPGYIEHIQKSGADAVIVSDPGVLETAREVAPGLPVHVSTQANTTNWKSALFWKKHGVERVIAARELSLQEIKEIKDKAGMEVEMFVHGAMCISYSGRCLLSNYMIGRDSNRGDCAHPCRWKYALMEEKRPGQYFPVEEDATGTYILSSRDLCLLEHIPRLASTGVDGLKIEGRVKSIHYVATVTRVYREAVDACIKDPADFRVKKKWVDEIGKVSNREYIAGFIDGPPEEGHFPPVDKIYCRPYTFVGVARGLDDNNSRMEIEQRNHFSRGETLEVLTPQGEVFSFYVDKMLDGEGSEIDRAPHPRQTVYLPSLPKVPPYSILRRRDS